MVKRDELVFSPAQGIVEGGRKFGLETEGVPTRPNHHSEVVLVKTSDKEVRNDMLPPIFEEPSAVLKEYEAFFQVVKLKGVAQGELVEIVQIKLIVWRTGGLNGRTGGRGMDRGCFRHFCNNFFLSCFFCRNFAYETPY